MRLLVVTEKSGPEEAYRDGGARLVTSLQRMFGSDIWIMQFGPAASPDAEWHYEYPVNAEDRFVRRLENAAFIADRVHSVAGHFTHILFVHISMQFGMADRSPTVASVWTFPMFLAPSYQESGEHVPKRYIEAERRALAISGCIITPSHRERRQLVDLYNVSPGRVRVIPRGIDVSILKPRARSFDGGYLRICSVGSIKRQKNTLALVRLFAKLRGRYPGAVLVVIGPVQDRRYAAEVKAEMERLGIGRDVTMTGYVAPADLAEVLANAHLHVTLSTCETFGRAIFETLASGLPNVAQASGNAAMEYLADRPYARFTDDEGEMLDAISGLLESLDMLSPMAMEIGELFDDRLLAQLLAAEISGRQVMAVSDFDGTLFHKNDHERTARCIDAFQRFPVRVVCSARPVVSLLDTMRQLRIEADWLIGCSGAEVADGNGSILWESTIEPHVVATLEAMMPLARRVGSDNAVRQVAIPFHLMAIPAGLRVEVYQEEAFIGSWNASKLRAVLRLLRHLSWQGRVRAFGDGPYDTEFLTYFDGTRIALSPVACLIRQAEEIESE